MSSTLANRKRRVASATASATASDPRWAQVVARDTAADGVFWYSVATTGVYCCPSCPARLAKPENVQFHGTVAAARRNGFRACLRCRPDEPSSDEARRIAIVTRACRSFTTAQTLPSLSELAAEAGLSPGYFHRLFKRKTGMTPKKYASMHRAELMRKQLDAGRTVTNAIYDAGFNSNSRFYEKSAETLGMRPSDFRDGGANTEVHFAVGQTSLGAILVASSDKGICAVLLGDDPGQLVRELQDQFSRAKLTGGDPSYEKVIAQVVGFVEAPGLGLDLPLDLRGTVFQRRVWAALREIAPGRTVTYSEIARQIGHPKAVRAVAGACAANFLAVAIPCHRVVRNDGAVSGYRWGIDRKRALIAREATPNA